MSQTLAEPMGQRPLRGRACSLLAAAWTFALLAGCAGKTAAASDTASDTASETASDAASDDAACDELLFGQPGAHTGLDETRCVPRCGCGGETWLPRSWDAAALAELRSWQLVEEPALPAVDPYSVATLDVAPPPAGAVCAVALEPVSAKRYRLLDFASAAAATAAGATVTHTGRCGLCSSLTDLAVYAGTTDLTDPVRQCGLVQIGDGFEASVTCLEKLGFSTPCATIWAYNTANTRKECLGSCMALLKAKSHLEDGSLNACLACDEEKSGPVFKAVAGRTRRNSGLPSALCRGCGGVSRVGHLYGFLE